MNWTWNSLSNGQQHAETCKHTRLRDLGSSILGKVPLKPPRMIKNVSEMLVKPTNNRFEERHDFLRNPAFRFCVLNWLPQKNGCSMCSEATKPALLSTLQCGCQGIFQLLQPSWWEKLVECMGCPWKWLKNHGGFSMSNRSLLESNEICAGSKNQTHQNGRWWMVPLSESWFCVGFET